MSETSVLELTLATWEWMKGVCVCVRLCSLVVELVVLFMLTSESVCTCITCSYMHICIGTSF